MLSRTVTIRNPHGVHARAAVRFVQAAVAHSAAVRLRKGEKVASGKSVLGLLMLGMKCGESVALEIDSDDSDALAQLEAILADLVDTESS
jgi:phosphotransferase system HPr (HPr) family protein